MLSATEQMVGTANIKKTENIAEANAKHVE